MGMSAPEGDADAPLSEINVTPLVDVMLVLLIVFMVSAPMLTTGLEVDLPDANAPQLPIEADQVVVTVRQDETVMLDEEEIERGALEERLRALGLEEVLVQADTRVPYGSVIEVLAAIRGAGIAKMGLVTDPVNMAAP